MPVTIRNLTSTPLTLDLVERFENPSAEKFQPHGGFSVGGLANDFGGLMKEVPIVGGDDDGKAKRKEIGNNAKGIKKEDVNVQLPPFRTQKTQVDTGGAGKGKNEHVLRLTFKDESGKRWRIDVPTSSGNAEKLVSLDNANKGFFGIYNDSSNFLALFEGTPPEKWMGSLPDGTPLNALSIPGTHNSPTCHTALPSVRCQAVSPKEQLQNGVRYFDLRVQVNDPKDAKSDELEMVHSKFPVSLTGSKYFKGIYEDIQEFLKKNPTETVIVSMKREGTGDAQDVDLAKRLHNYYLKDKIWYMKPGIPTLGDVRGKITLLRRFNLNDDMKKEAGGAFGINAQAWADNTPNSRGGDVQVQDFYEVKQDENIEKKTKYVCDHCERAGEEAVVHGKNQPMFINFLSASNFFKPGMWPDKVAGQINPQVTKFLCEKHDANDKGDGGTGILVCDWVGQNGDWDLVRAIVGMNAKLLAKGGAGGGGGGGGAAASASAQAGKHDGADDDDNDKHGEGGRGGRGGGRGGRGRGGGRGGRGGHDDND